MREIRLDLKYKTKDILFYCKKNCGSYPGRASLSIVCSCMRLFNSFLKSTQNGCTVQNALLLHFLLFTAQTLMQEGPWIAPQISRGVMGEVFFASRNPPFMPRIDPTRPALASL